MSNMSTYILCCNLIQNWTLIQTKASQLNGSRGHSTVITFVYAYVLVVAIILNVDITCNLQLVCYTHTNYDNL